MIAQYCLAAEAASLISDGAVIAVSGSGGGLLEPDAVLAAVEERFLAEGHPRGLTLVHAFGIGDRDARGTNRLAHAGMTRRVIGGHWSWSPRMMELARSNQLAGYAWPSGVIVQLLREIGSRRPGLITRTGLGTYVDPRQAGGRINERAANEPDSLVELLELDGQEYLRFKPFRVDVAVVRGAVADRYGNISCAGEPAQLDVFAAAQAARACGGTVIAQVQRRLDGSLDPWLVHVPAALVDRIVVVADQQATYAGPVDAIAAVAAAPARNDVRRTIALRAAREVHPGDVVNLGFGVSAGVADVLAENGEVSNVTMVVEQGLFGGTPLSGDLFGVVRGPTAVVSATAQFDLFGGGLIDVSCLGMAQVDAVGDVNVSMIDGAVVGPGGFIDISQNARRLVFCGTFTTKGLSVRVDDDGRLSIAREGSVQKFVSVVDQVSFSGRLALERGQEVLYVTERAVFRLTRLGLELIEITPGIDLERDVLGLMGFRPIVGDVRQVATGGRV